MFTAASRKNGQKAAEYFDEHLSQNDYYCQKQSRPGRWIGEGVARLGLTEDQTISREQFLSLCENRDPVSGNQLTLRSNSVGNRRVFFDFTCSAPKSVSIMAVTMNDPRILEAHQAAARVGLKELEQFAATRIRKNFAQEDRPTASLVGASFVHTTSRALDPQLHTHFVLFNCTYDPTEQCWKALQAGKLYEAIHYGTEVYRNDLARRLRELGYQTRRIANGFEIEGVSRELQQRFSKRAQQREAMVAWLEAKCGHKLSQNDISRVIHETRPAKVEGVTDEQVRQMQLDQLTVAETAGLREVIRQAQKIKPPSMSIKIMQESVSYSMAHCFERNSVVPEHQLLRMALERGCGQLDLAQLKEQVRQDAEMVRAEDRYTTHAILETECYLIRCMNEGKQTVRPIDYDYAPSAKLGIDQREAVRLICQSPDRYTGIRGLAGSGKSTALGELAEAMKHAGYEAVYCAPTAAATEVLRADGHEAVTLARLLADDSIRRRLSATHVIVLDEAGAVGIDDMKSVFKLAETSDCRVVFSGDTGQHASVARGDALRILEEHSRYSYGQLNRIRRQRAPAYAQLVEWAANKETKRAFMALWQQDSVTELPTEDLYAAAAGRYIESIRKQRSVLMIAPTWKEIDALTAQVREELKSNYLLKRQEQRVSVLRSLSWTAAQKRNGELYEPGLRIAFHRPWGRHNKHEVAEVVAVEKGSVRIRLTDGCEEQLELAAAADRFDVCEQRQIGVASGERLLIQANRAGQFVNGELVTVRSVDEGRIRLEDGRLLPEDFRRFCHGYAVTSHGSQGRTVDDVLLVASSCSLAAVNRQQFYVSISRGREQCEIFTDDTEQLFQRIAGPDERLAAVELIQQIQQRQKLAAPKRHLAQEYSIYESERYEHRQEIKRGISI